MFFHVLVKIVNRFKKFNNYSKDTIWESSWSVLRATCIKDKCLLRLVIKLILIFSTTKLKLSYSRLLVLLFFFIWGPYGHLSVYLSLLATDNNKHNHCHIYSVGGHEGVNILLTRVHPCTGSNLPEKKLDIRYFI